jgi:hypothetical protein
MPPAAGRVYSMCVSSLVVHSALAFGVGLVAVSAAAGSEATSSQVEGASQAAAESFDAGEAYVTCGARALALWLRLLGYEVEEDEVLNYVPVGEQGSSLAQLAEAAQRWTRAARLVKAGPRDLNRFPLPMIAHGWVDGETGRRGHYVVIVKVTPKVVVYIDPGRGLAGEVARSDFETYFWSGYLLTRKDTLGTWNRYLAFTGLVLGALCGSHVVWEMLRRRRAVAAAALLAASLILPGCGEPSVPRSAGPEATIPPQTAVR